MMRQLLASVVMGRFKRAPLLVLALAGSACSSATGPGPLNDARALWEQAGITNYSYELRPQCFCGFVGNSVVTVSNGEVVSVFAIDSQRFLGENEIRLYVPVEALFDIIEDAQSQNAHSIEVEYDPTFGFPTDFFIDFKKNTIDEELGYSARRLTIE